MKKAEGEHAQAHQEHQTKQEQTGQVNAQANERVSIANHEHNMNANKHHEEILKAKQGQNQNDFDHVQAYEEKSTAKHTSKKADKQ